MCWPVFKDPVHLAEKRQGSIGAGPRSIRPTSVLDDKPIPVTGAESRMPVSWRSQLESRATDIVPSV